MAIVLTGPSVNFAIDGQVIEDQSTLLIGDFVTPNDMHGVFVFVKGGLLAGVEVFQMAADLPCRELPETVGLRPVLWTEKGVTELPRHVVR